MKTSSYREILDRICKKCYPTGNDIHKYMSKRATILSGIDLADIYINQGKTQKANELMEILKIEMSKFSTMFPSENLTSDYTPNSLN